MVEEALNFKYLKESGFSDQQIEALFRFNKEQIEKQATTKKDLSLIRKNLELIKKDRMIWLGGFVISGVIFSCAYLSWLFNYLDNKTRTYADIRVESLKTEMNIQLESLKTEMDVKFNNMETLLNHKFNDIKADIKELKELYKK